MTIEFIPTPSQLITMLDSGIDYKCVKSHDHNFYYVYITNDVAEFTAELMGVLKISALLVNNVERLAMAMAEWNNHHINQQFQSWRKQFNTRPGIRRI